MKRILLALTFLSPVFAIANEINCAASTAWHIKILQQQKLVQVYQWQTLKDEFTIQSTSVKFLESKPPQMQTSFNVEDGYSFVVTLSTDPAQRGTGYATKNGNKAAEYYHCFANQESGTSYKGSLTLK